MAWAGPATSGSPPAATRTSVHAVQTQPRRIWLVTGRPPISGRRVLIKGSFGYGRVQAVEPERPPGPPPPAGPSASPPRSQPPPQPTTARSPSISAQAADDDHQDGPR